MAVRIHDGRTVRPPGRAVGGGAAGSRLAPAFQPPDKDTPMPWLLLLIAVALFLAALGASSMLLVVLCVIGSLGLSIVAVMILLAQRVDNSSRSEALLIDPQELRRLREQAEARRAEAGNPAPQVAANDTGVQP